MNFHKTIGFLAALLLTLGLGVPDSFAQVGITLSPTTVVEGTQIEVTVTVDLTPDLAAGTTVVVMVSVDAADAMGGSIPITVTTDTDGSATGTLNITARQDADAKDKTTTVTGALSGYQSGTAALAINDDEGEVTASVTPATVTEGGGAQTVAVTLELAGRGNFAEGVASTVTAASDVTVNAMLGDENIGTAVLTVALEASSATGDLVITPPDDNNNAEDEDVLITAVLAHFVPVAATVTIDDDEGGLTFAVSPERLTEGDGPQTVTVSLTLVRPEDNTDDVTVTVTATLGGGVSQITGGVTVAGSATEETVVLTITPANDADMNDETVEITAEAMDYIVGTEESPATQTVTIIDDDQANVVAVVVDPMELTEGMGATTVAVSVTLTPVSLTSDVTVTVDANAGGFTIATTTITVAANMEGMAGTLVIDPPDDDGNDVDDVIVVSATGSTVPEGGTPEDDEVTYTGDPANITVKDIHKTDGTIQLAFSAEEVQEDAGPTDIAVTVTLQPAPQAATPVVLTATIGETMHSSTTVTVPTTGTGIGALRITPTNDQENMGDVAVTVNAEAEGYDFPTPDMLTIVEDDIPARTIELAISPKTLTEETGADDATVAVTLTLTPAPSSNVSVTVNATSGGFIISSVTVTVTGGSDTGSGNLFIPRGDDPDDDDQIVTVATAAAVPGYGTPDSQTLTIEDDDKEQTVTITLSPDELTEEGGAQVVTVTVMLEHAPLTGEGDMVKVTARSNGVTIDSDDVDVSSGSGTGMLTIRPAPDADSDHETVVVTATYDDDDDGDEDEPTPELMATATLTIVDTEGGPIVPPAVGMVTLTTDTDRVREDARARSIQVTATLPEAPGTGNTVVVMVTGTVEGTDGGTTVSSVDISISGTNTSGTGTLTITPHNDDAYTTRTVKLTATASGYNSGEAAPIVIVDNDASKGTLSFSNAQPPSVTMGGGAQSVTLTVKVVLATADAEIPNPLVVNVMTDKGTLASPTVSITNIRQHPDHDPATRLADGTIPVVLSLNAAEAAAAGTITVTASAENYVSGTRTIPIRARGALDIAGYRAVLVKPAANGWAPVGNDKVIVDLKRVGSVAYPWSDFTSIKVSVRDTAHNSYEIDAVTARNFNLEDGGTLTFEEPGSRSRGDVIWRGNDTVRFEIRIRPRNDQGSTDPASNGQYLGAYAHIEFTAGNGLTESFTNRDSDKPVYPSNPSLVSEADRYKGDGKLFKVDNLVPSNAAIAGVNVTNKDGEPVTAVKVGDEVRVAVAVSGNVLFRDSGIRVQIQPQDGTGSYRGKTYTAAQVAPFTKTVNFSASQVIAAASDSLRTSWKITEGFFEHKTDDFVDFIGSRGTRFQPDNATGRVLVQVKDQAANYSGARITTFAADSRSPKVSILYPSADPDSLFDHTHPMRFSGATFSTVEGRNVDKHLNPLVISVDEALSSLQVFAVGADTLTIANYRDGLVGMSGDPGKVDSIEVDTSPLSSTKKDGEGDDDKYPDTAFVPSSANVAGTEITLAILATDTRGNTTKTTMSGVTHDAAKPMLSDWFPKNSLLPDGQINDATRHPVFELPEAVDSIAVTFAASGGATIVEERAGVTAKGETQVVFSKALTDEESYTMTIFTRDLAGNVSITPQDESENMRFNAQFDNPRANQFSITNMTAVTATNETAADSVIAGQAIVLEVQAIDHDASSDTKRDALTYKNVDENGNTAAEVRISAWDANGGVAGSVWFEGTGVMDDAEPDGMATLDAAGWLLGKRDVTAKSNKATGLIKILIEHRNAGTGSTTVAEFNGDIDSLYVGAADFNKFMITAEKGGEKVESVDTGDKFTLRVVPVDRHYNPSVRAFKSDPASAEDSLAVLDTRAKDNAYDYKDGFAITIRSSPTLKGLPAFEWQLDPEGWPFTVTAPDEAGDVSIQVRIDNTTLNSDDKRSQNTRTGASVTIVMPLTPELTLWVPGMDTDQAGNNVEIPADPGTITVTVAAEGYNAGSMVTFTKNGTAMDPVAANDDGTATLDITMAEAGTVTVSATDGRYPADELAITFVQGSARMAYVDANGDPVYLVYAGDAPSDMTVGVDDFLALVAAFGSSEGDENYNAQADVNDDGMVSVADFSEFIKSFGRTAVGPATKPLVLLPGINENAEFTLSLGSERVIAGETVAVDVSLANVAALIGYGFALNYETDKFEFVSVAPADEDLLKSTGGETLFHHVVADGQITVANGVYNGTAVSGGGDVVRFVFRVLREFEDNARFEIADGLVFDPSQLQNPAVVAGVLELQSTPREFALHQNFPNPFNPDTTIKYDLAESADVTLQIYNVLGQVVRTLVASEAQNAGRYQIRWNGMDDRGVPVSSGIYFYQIAADGKFSDVRKLMLLK